MADSLAIADVAVIPVRPCAFDVYTMRLVDNLVIEARAGNPSLRALALINQASTNHLSQEAQQTRDVILAGCSGSAAYPISVTTTMVRSGSHRRSWKIICRAQSVIFLCGRPILWWYLSDGARAVSTGSAQVRLAKGM